MENITTKEIMDLLDKRLKALYTTSTANMSKENVLAVHAKIDALFQLKRDIEIKAGMIL